MEFDVEGSVRNRKFINAIMPSMIAQMGLQNSRKAVLIKVSDECDGCGFTIPIDMIDSYLVMIKPNRKLKEIALTLAHEMVHVRQFAKGMLKITPKGSVWMGKLYPKKTAYLDQPWEIDAFSKQELVLRRAIEE